MIICPTCKNENDDGADYCEHCGRPLADVAPSAADDKPSTLVIDTLDLLQSAPQHDPDSPRISLSSSSTDSGSPPGLSLGMVEADSGNDLSLKLRGNDQPAMRVTATHTLVEGIPAIKADAAPQDATPADAQEPGEPTRIIETLAKPDKDKALTPPPALISATSESLRATQAVDMPSGGWARKLAERKQQKAAQAAAENNAPSANTKDDGPTAAPSPPNQDAALENTLRDEQEGRATPGSRHHTQENEALPMTPQPVTRATISTGALIGVLSSMVFLLVITAAITVHLIRSNTPPADDVHARPTGTAEVPAGPYLRGLANDYRLMFSRNCKKFVDDPEAECKEDIALKDEVPQESVEVAAFKMDLTEVTHEDWARCVKDGACAEIKSADCENWTLRGKRPSFRRVPRALFRTQKPVVCVNRAEAQAYCKFAGGALPTPDQWEKAARGDKGYTLPWGTNWNPRHANWGEKDQARFDIAGALDGHADTAPVGSYPEGRSPYGLYDMTGNVSEWVKPAKKTKGAAASARGGSWRSAPLEMRVTRRLFINADTRRTDVGFRCVYE